MRLMLPDSVAPAADPWQLSAPRHEMKFVGAARAAGLATATLAAACPRDDEFPANVVHSVYFDSPRLVSYAQKANGEYLKTKIRLRWYARPGLPPPGAGESWIAWLEVKLRQGSRGFKRRKRLVLGGPSPAEGGDPDALGALVHRELGSPWRAACWLSYTRSRLRWPDGTCRISVDRDLRAEWVAPWARPRVIGVRLPLFVVEVKGDSPVVHPGLASLIARHATKRPVSKYALCLEYAWGGGT